MVTFGSFEKADAMVVRIAHLPGEFLLSQFALHFTADRPGAECQPGHVDAGFTERYPIGSLAPCCPQGQASGSREHTRGEPGFQEIASGAVSHSSSSNGHILS